MSVFNFERRTSIVLGGLATLVVLMVAGASFGDTRLLEMFAGIGSIFLGLVLFTESAFLQWATRSPLKKIEVNDVVVILSAVVGTGFIIQGITIFNTVGKAIPDGLQTFLTANGVVMAVLGAGLFLYLAFTKRPR